MINYNKYAKYKKKYIELKKLSNDNNLIKNSPKKYIILKNKIITSDNTIDNEILDKKSEFLIGSLTKIYISLLVLHLHQCNKLNITDCVAKYIKSNKWNNFDDITIWDLLNHRSGLKHHVNYIDFNFDEFKKGNYSAEYVVESIIKENIITSNKSYNYSNSGYYLLGRIIEIACDNIWWKVLNDTVPILKNTGIGYPNNIMYDSKEIINPTIDNTIAAISAGGMYSSIDDIVNYIDIIISKFNNNTINLLKNMYYMTQTKNNSYQLIHNGNVSGSKSFLKIKWNNHWVMTSIMVSFETIVN